MTNDRIIFHAAGRSVYRALVWGAVTAAVAAFALDEELASARSGVLSQRQASDLAGVNHHRVATLPGAWA